MSTKEQQLGVLLSTSTFVIFASLLVGIPSSDAAGSPDALELSPVHRKVRQQLSSSTSNNLDRATATERAALDQAPLGLAHAGCPAATVPWPTADPTHYECQPVAEAAAEAYDYLIENMFSFDQISPNAHTLIDGIFNNTVNKSLSARQAFPWAASVPKFLFREWGERRLLLDLATAR